MRSEEATNLSNFKISVELIVLAVSAAATIVFAATVPGFATSGNFENMVRDSAPLLILSCAMGVVVIGRGLDLSLVAAMTSVAAVFGVLILSGQSAALTLAAATCMAVVLGLFNGWLVAYIEIPSILATLASAILFTGLARWGILQGEFLLVLPKEHALLSMLSGGRIAGLHISTPIAALVVTITWLFLSKTAFGHAVRATGDNPLAARLIGLPTRLTTLVVYVFSALAAMVAGLLIASSSGTVDFRIVANGTLLFDVIMVVVLGGITLRGGRGGILSILAGVALISVLRNGMTLLNLSTQDQALAKGLVLIAAVVIDNHLNPRDLESDTVGDL